MEKKLTKEQIAFLATALLLKTKLSISPVTARTIIETKMKDLLSFENENGGAEDYFTKEQMALLADEDISAAQLFEAGVTASKLIQVSALAVAFIKSEEDAASHKHSV